MLQKFSFMCPSSLPAKLLLQIRFDIQNYKLIMELNRVYACKVTFCVRLKAAGLGVLYLFICQASSWFLFCYV